MNVRYWARHPWILGRRIYYYFYEHSHPEEPFLAPAAVRFLDENLSRTGRGLEWGSGRSTPWFAVRLGQLVAVEHDEVWYRDISSRLETSSMRNVDYRLIPLDHPVHEPTQPRYERVPGYVACIREFADESFDFVVVDGHYRQACVLEALSKLKPGGLLLVDDTNWLRLQDWQVPPEWPIVHQSTKINTVTTIWKKPGQPAS
jgi:SAM-dependent methyltransferase